MDKSEQSAIDQDVSASQLRIFLRQSKRYSRLIKLYKIVKKEAESFGVGVDEIEEKFNEDHPKPPLVINKIKNLQIGDITVKDVKSLGVDFYIGKNRIMWINDSSEDELIKWLSQRPKVTGEITRQSSGRIRPKPIRKQPIKLVTKNPTKSTL
jgi:hypothetical protein